MESFFLPSGPCGFFIEGLEGAHSGLRSVSGELFVFRRYMSECFFFLARGRKSEAPSKQSGQTPPLFEVAQSPLPLLSPAVPISFLLSLHIWIWDIHFVPFVSVILPSHGKWAWDPFLSSIFSLLVPAMAYVRSRSRLTALPHRADLPPPFSELSICALT